MTAEETLTISDEYAVSDLFYALSQQKQEADGNSRISKLFFCHVEFTKDVLEALQQLQGNLYTEVTLFNCRGDNFAPSLEYMLTKMTVQKLLLEYTEFNIDGTPIFQEQEAKALAIAFIQESSLSSSSMKSIHLKGLTKLPALRDAIKEVLTRSSVESFQWTQGLFGQIMALPRASNTNVNDPDPAEYAFWNDVLVGLQSCSTLTRLTIKYTESDTIMSMILSGLRSHPTLQFIAVSVKDLGSDMENGIRNLLANDNSGSTALQTLKLSTSGGFARIPSLPRPPLEQRFKYILELYFSSDDHMEALGEGLSRNDAIEEVYLRYHSVTSDGLATFSSWLGQEGTKLRKLHMDGRSIDIRGAQNLLGAIEKNPYWLEIVDLPISCPLRPFIQHHADINKAGWSKMLRTESRGKSQLSLWPQVMERASRLTFTDKCAEENAQRRANAIFHHLRGPAVLHRAQQEKC